jgi:hypothetical protein
MSISALEACDLLRFAAGYTERLSEAASTLERSPALTREREWLSAARALVTAAATPGPALLERAPLLPELPELRADRAGAAQGEWVDALEKLLAGITFHVSGRAPMIEALFPHQKFAPLRKVGRDVAQKFQQDFEKRLRSGYVSRMMGTPDFAFAVPVVERIRAAFAAWEACFGDGGLSVEAARALRAELARAGAAVDLALRQARLLAEAALLPVPGAFEQAQLAQKPKRRASRPVGAPTPDEVAAAEAEEVAALAEAEAERASALEQTAPAAPPLEAAPAPEPAKRKRARRKGADVQGGEQNEGAAVPRPEAGS